MDHSLHKPSRRELLRLALAGGVAGLAGTGPAWAQQSDAKKAEDLVTECALAIEDMLAAKSEPALKHLSTYIEQARAVMIYPAIFKGGFIIGGEGGSGVLLAKSADGSWSSPAFYTLAGGSIGLQIGGQVSKVCFTVMTDGGLDAILENNVKFGGDLLPRRVFAGPVGQEALGRLLGAHQVAGQPDRVGRQARRLSAEDVLVRAIRWRIAGAVDHPAAAHGGVADPPPARFEDAVRHGLPCPSLR